MKTKLEDMILGQGSARNEMIMRRKGMSYAFIVKFKHNF